MNHLNIHHRPEALYLSEQRKFERQEAIHLLAVTERGTGQILDISCDGFAFGCLYPHSFPSEFSVDILDAKGSHIKKIQVKKIWETTSNFVGSSGIFELVVGVEFVGCSFTQAEELNYLLSNMDKVECAELRLI